MTNIRGDTEGGRGEGGVWIVYGGMLLEIRLLYSPTGNITKKL